MGEGSEDPSWIDRFTQKNRCIGIISLFSCQHSDLVGHYVIKLGTIVFARDALGNGNPEEDIVIALTFLQ